MGALIAASDRFTAIGCGGDDTNMAMPGNLK
jgi:hypothetical protein